MRDGSNMIRRNRELLKAMINQHKRFTSVDLVEVSSPMIIPEGLRKQIKPKIFNNSPPIKSRIPSQAQKMESEPPKN